jgi:aminocarboxymuconate-semialdehyde decarboxylase
VFVDVHGHLAPLGESGGGPPSLFDPERSLAVKREHGIVLTIIGSPAGPGSMLPHEAAGNYRQPVGRVRAHNEAMGALVDRYPRALRAYAYLDPFGGEAMLRQALELLDDRRFVGLMVNSSIEGELLGSPRAAEFFAMAAQRQAPVLVHPPAAPIGAAAVSGLGLGAVEHLARPCDVTLGIASVVCGGYLDRHPDLRLIAAAGGGALSVLAPKLDLAIAARPGAAGPDPAAPAAASETLRRVYVDTSTPGPAQLRANLEFFGPRQVLFGTDSPPLLGQVSSIVSAVAGAGLSTADAEEVGWRNAARLFGSGVADLMPAVGASGRLS